MRRPVVYLWFPVLILVSVFASCRERDTITNTDNNTPKNIPVTANVSNSFSFVVDASTFNYTHTSQVQINADTLTIAITITNFVSGSGSITITDSSGASIYAKDLNTAMVSADVLKLTAVPKNIAVVLNNFSGSVAIALAGK